MEVNVYLNSLNPSDCICTERLYSKILYVAHSIQGLSKRFERFKFGIFYVLIVKIRYNFTHK